jgi:hypothetical protein
VDTEIIDLGEVQAIRISPLDDEWMCNTVEVGYEQQEYDYPLGRQEFATTLEFINELKVSNTKLDLVSKYRADYSGIHLLHFDYITSPKKDGKRDSDIFFIIAFLVDEKWQTVNGDGFIVTGMEGGGYFNILLSPHRNLIRHIGYIGSVLDKISPKQLKYVSSTESMTDMSSMVESVFQSLVKEKSDETIPPTTPILFKPFTFEFDCIVPKNLPELLGESPAGYFTFHYNNLVLKGFPIEVAGSYKNSKQTVKCVAHPDTPDNIQELLFKRLSNRLYN